MIVVGLTYFPVLALGPIVEQSALRSTVTPDSTLPPGEPRPHASVDLAVRPGDRARASSTAFVKLDPRHMVRNPVMFVVEIGSVLTTVLFFRTSVGDPNENVFAGLVAAWLWFTVLFANFAEAVAEGRGKAQADTLRKTRAETVAHRAAPDGSTRGGPEHRSSRSATRSSSRPAR